MKTRWKTSDSFSLAVLLGAFALTFAVYDRLPARLATHFDLHGVANGWMNKSVGAWLLPVTGVVVWGALRFGIPLFSPTQRARLETSSAEATITLLVFLMTGIQCLVLNAAIAHPTSIGAGLAVLSGASWIGLGLVLPRIRQNRWIGVRTPWTLSSEENWARTHRVAGFTFAAGGAIAMALTLAGATTVALAILVASALAPVPYSFALSRTLPPHA